MNLNHLIDEEVVIHLKNPIVAEACEHQDEEHQYTIYGTLRTVDNEGITLKDTEDDGSLEVVVFKDNIVAVVQYKEHSSKLNLVH
jgi:hypothetical protein